MGGISQALGPWATGLRGACPGRPLPAHLREACGRPAWSTAGTHSHRTLAGSRTHAAFSSPPWGSGYKAQSCRARDPKSLSGNIRAAWALGYLASCAAVLFLTICWVLSVLLEPPASSWEVETVSQG